MVGFCFVIINYYKNVIGRIFPKSFSAFILPLFLLIIFWIIRSHQSNTLKIFLQDLF